MTDCCRELVLKEAALIVDRTVAQPIHAQVSNYIRLAIADGRLPAGARMPSIRELADTLDVAINTIARAYKDLSNEGLIESMPGRGSVISVEPVLQGDIRGQRSDFLRSIIQPAARRARMLGYEWDDILKVLEESIAVVRAPSSIGLVASSEVALEMYRRALEEELADLDVSVIPVTLKDLESNVRRSLKKFAKSQVVVSLADSFSDTRSMLEPRNKKVVPLLTELSIQTHDQLAELPKEGKIGLICTKARKNHITWLVSLYCHPFRTIWLPDVGSDSEIEEVNDTAAIIYDEDVPFEQVQGLVAGKQEVKLQFVLNVQSVENLRNLLGISSILMSN